MNNLTEEQQIKLKRLKKRQEFIRMTKYFCFSISAGVIQALALTLFQELLHFQEWLAYILSLVLSVLWNFTFNRKFTFKSANNVPIAMAKVAGYYAVFTPLSTWWVHVLTSGKFGINAYVVEFATMAINCITEAIFYRFVVFGKSINTSKDGEMEEGRILNEINKA